MFLNEYKIILIGIYRISQDNTYRYSIVNPDPNNIIKYQDQLYILTDNLPQEFQNHDKKVEKFNLITQKFFKLTKQKQKKVFKNFHSNSDEIYNYIMNNLDTMHDCLEENKKEIIKE